ncbi:MAG: hypothetical protein OEZ48_12725 [Candidatus Bathyarchaeota archaeon]|nr:hypothetical protein [Candidatus Bathyarchaeota archaeon]MDH5688709.1 hypothetical protein [Candidatus Bathyarchaeota archaeon]
MSRILNVASALLVILGMIDVFSGLSHLFMPADATSEWLAVMGVDLAVSEIRDFSPGLLDSIGLKMQWYGVYALSYGLITWVIALIPYRKGERWAWYSILVVGAISVSVLLVLIYTGLPSMLPIVLLAVILWIAGLALPAKEILGKPS